MIHFYLVLLWNPSFCRCLFLTYVLYILNLLVVLGYWIVKGGIRPACRQWFGNLNTLQPRTKKEVSTPRLVINSLSLAGQALPSRVHCLASWEWQRALPSLVTRLSCLKSELQAAWEESEDHVEEIFKHAPEFHAVEYNSTSYASAEVPSLACK